MILNFLLIMIVSAIAFALLIPPIKIEDAKAQDFNDGGLPRATENAPIAFLIGRDRLNAPNTIYVGGYRSVAIKKKVKTGIFSSKKITTGYKYYLTVDLGFCTGGGDGVTLHEVFVDDVSVWTGTLSTQSTFSISAPSIFGGDKNGGGFTVDCEWFPGTMTQTKSAIIDAELGPDNMLPNYNGIAHLVFKGCIGESPQLRKIAIVASRFTNELGLPDGKHIIQETTLNPAEVLYATMTDTWTGMGVDPALIDDDNLYEAGLLYHSENNGCGGSLYTAKQGKAFAQDIVSQVDAIITIDPSTNKMVLRSLRFDYDPTEVPVFNESQILSVDSFSQTLWTDLISEVKITFKDESNLYNEATASDQDLAVAGITGRLKTTNISMPLVRKTTLATTLAGRELNQLSKPATSAVLVFNRKGYKLQPGSVFRWNWNDYNGLSMIMRVKKAQAGSDEDATIQVEVTKDPYGEIYTTFASPGTSPTDPLTLIPDPVEVFSTWDTHRFIVDTFTDVVPSSDPDVSFMTLLPIAADAKGISVSAVIGDDESSAFEDLPFPDVGLLLTAIDIMDGFEDGTLAVVTIAINPIPEDWQSSAGTVQSGGNLIYINKELLGFEDFEDNLDGTVDLLVVHRGLLNTMQQSHSSLDVVFPLTDFGYVSESASFLPDDPDPVKFLPSSGSVALSPADITPANVTITGGYNRPDAPDYMLIEGSRTTTEVASGGTVTVDWYPRDRMTAAVRLIDDAADTNPAGVTWDLYLWDLVNDVSAFSVTGLTLPTYDLTVPTDPVLYGETVEVRVYAIKDSRSSLVYDFYRFIVLAPSLLLSGDGVPGYLMLSGDGAPGKLNL